MLGSLALRTTGSGQGGEGNKRQKNRQGEERQRGGGDWCGLIVRKVDREMGVNGLERQQHVMKVTGGRSRHETLPLRGSGGQKRLR